MLNREGGLINFLPLKRGGLLEKGAYLREGLNRGFTVIAKQTITFFATHNYNPIFNLLKLCGSCSGHVQCIAGKCAVDLR